MRTPKLATISLPMARNILFLAAALLGISPGCVGKDKVEVKVTFQSRDPQQKLHRVVATVAGEKSSWPEVAAGQTVRVILDPKGDLPQLTLVYTLAGKRLAWEGPQMPNGVGYRIAATIDDSGSVTHRNCLLPCSL